MSIPISNPWDRPGEEVVEPSHGASPDVIAEFLLDDEANTGERLTPMHVARFAKNRGADPAAVVHAMRHARAGARDQGAHVERDAVRAITRFPSPIIGTAGLGAPVHDKAGWAQVRAEGLVPKSARLCPHLLWFMDRMSGVVFPIKKPCESWWCEETCSGEKAQVILDHAARSFSEFATIYYAMVADSDANTVARIRQRRHQRGGETLWVRRFDGTVHVFSTKDLPGRTPPERFSALLPVEARAVLQRQALLLPGPVARRWSRGWNITDPASGPGSGSTSAALGGGARDVIDEAWELALAEVEERYGVDPTTDFTPDQIETIWLPIVRAAIARVKAQRWATSGD